jgi:hypothetical protein
MLRIREQLTEIEITQDYLLTCKENLLFKNQIHWIYQPTIFQNISNRNYPHFSNIALVYFTFGRVA